MWNINNNMEIEVKTDIKPEELKARRRRKESIIISGYIQKFSSMSEEDRKLEIERMVKEDERR